MSYYHGPDGRVGRKKRTTGRDMCSCGTLNCDVGHSRPDIQEKLHTRYNNKCCIACGHKECTCKHKEIREFKKISSQRRAYIIGSSKYLTKTRLQRKKENW